MQMHIDDNILLSIVNQDDILINTNNNNVGDDTNYDLYSES